MKIVLSILSIVERGSIVVALMYKFEYLFDLETIHQSIKVPHV